MRLKKHIREFERRGTPGHRFQGRYYEEQKSAQKGKLRRRFIRIAVAAVAIVIGAILAVMPGPAIWFFLIAGVMLASDSLVIARTLDWTELRARSIYKWVRRHWVPMPVAVKGAIISAACLCSAAATYMSIRIMRG